MKRRKEYYQIVILAICIFLSAGFANAQDENPCKTGGQTCYFGVEINEMLCGYSIETSCDGVFNGKPVRYENSEVTLKMSLLGADVDISIKFLYYIDPFTDRVLMADITQSAGQLVQHTETRVRNDTLLFSNITSGIKKAIPLNNDFIFYSQTGYPWLLKDFNKPGVTEVKYKVYDPLRGELVDKIYIRKGDEAIRLADTTYYTVLVEETDLSTGIKTLIWLAKKDAFNLKISYAGRNIYLSDKSVINRVKMADMNSVFFTKLNRIIPDFFNVKLLKVKATINSYGENLTPESLNFKGQKFTGTVSESLIDGYFETAPVKYSGKNAPPYPPDFSKINDLKKYIDPELLIESDNPEIITEARKIAAGSHNSWEAAIRLGKWVAENIYYAIPGGGSAINTFKSREAECGGHSRLLAAFCRAVGIPARLSIGCIYTTNFGGTFGQHAWTEIYMGEAGWIPVDATLNQPDFIDAGHIRLGEKTNFQPKAMEIIEFKTGGEFPEASVSLPDAYKSLIGAYTDMNNFRVFRVLYKESALSVDIPGQMVVPLYDPDEKGQWYPKLSRLLSFSFVKNSVGKIDKMILSQYAPLKKMSKPDTIPGNISEEFLKYIGNYAFQPAKLSLDVSFSGDFLTMQDPRQRTKERLKFLNRGDYWIDETGNTEVSFESDINKEVVRMNLTVKNHLLRGEPVISALTPVIRNEGIEAGIKKYNEIKSENTGDYILSDAVLNRLGHQLLTNSKTEDAIQIFRLAVENYPDSFLVNDSLAETYLKQGEKKLALHYFRAAVKLNPDYEYGKKMIVELNNKK